MTQIQFDILYKNGHEETFLQEITDKNKTAVKDVVTTFKECFYNNDSGLVTIGDEMTNGAFIRVSDVSRVNIVILNSEEKTK